MKVSIHELIELSCYRPKTMQGEGFMVCPTTHVITSIPFYSAKTVARATKTHRKKNVSAPSGTLGVRRANLILFFFMPNRRDCLYSILSDLLFLDDLICLDSFSTYNLRHDLPCYKSIIFFLRFWRRASSHSYLRNVFVYLFFQLRNKERLLLFPSVTLCLTLFCWILALVFFLSNLTSWQVNETWIQPLNLPKVCQTPPLIDLLFRFSQHE